MHYMDVPWRFIHSGTCEAGLNMAIDEAIADHVRSGDVPPTLRVYSWEKPSVTIGCFQKITDIDLPACSRNAITVVRRPTGGRAILHDHEVTYSFSSMNSSMKGFQSLFTSYELLSDAFLKAFRSFTDQVEVSPRRIKRRSLIRKPHCFETVSYGEILLEGHKIIGSAQKRYRTGFLQQGSIPLSINRDLHGTIFTTEAAMVGIVDIHPDVTFRSLVSYIKDAFEQTFYRGLTSCELTQSEVARARALVRKKYHSPGWTLTHRALRNNR